MDEIEAAASARDMIALLTNTTCDIGHLGWLASCSLPESVSSAVKTALIRRARASDVTVMLEADKSPYEVSD